MLQNLRVFTQRANAADARVASSAATASGFGLSMTGAATAWNAKPPVHTTAICTHGKGYERRLRELLT